MYNRSLILSLYINLVLLFIVNGKKNYEGTTKSDHSQQLEILRDTKIKQNRQWEEGQPCPTGWVRYNESCYWGSPNTLSWFAAEHQCRSFGYDAHLASIHSMDENRLVQAMSGCGASWIGLTKVSLSKSDGWAWTDTSDNDFTFWRSGNPVGVDERNCAYQEKGSANPSANGWSNGYCTELRPYTCKADAKVVETGQETEQAKEGEKEGNGTAQEKSHPKEHQMRNKRKNRAVHSKTVAREENTPVEGESSGPCAGEAGWMDGKNGFCYFYSSSKANWFEAESRCRAMGASLLDVKQEAEQRLAMFGGCDRRTWLGAVRWQPEDRWHWYHDMSYVGDDDSYTNWAQNNTGVNYVVSFMDTTGNGAGRWFDSPSPFEQMYYVCKQYAVDTNEGSDGSTGHGEEKPESEHSESSQSQGGHTENDHTENDHTENDHIENDHTENDHTENGHSENGHSESGHSSNDQSENGHVNGTSPSEPHNSQPENAGHGETTERTNEDTPNNNSTEKRQTLRNKN